MINIHTNSITMFFHHYSPLLTHHSTHHNQPSTITSPTPRSLPWHPTGLGLSLGSRAPRPWSRSPPPGSGPRATRCAATCRPRRSSGPSPGRGEAAARMALWRRCSVWVCWLVRCDITGVGMETFTREFMVNDGK